MQTTATDDGIAPASGILAAVAGRDEHVLLPAGVSRAVLDDVAARLAALRSRVLRPSTAGVLTLPGLLAQIVGRTPDAAFEASDLERGFELLTVGPDCDRIVLLLDRADALDEAALRYLQMAIRGAPLRLLFVGGSRLDELLAGEDFRALRRGFVWYAAPFGCCTRAFLRPTSLAPGCRQRCFPSSPGFEGPAAAGSNPAVNLAFPWRNRR